MRGIPIRIGGRANRGGKFRVLPLIIFALFALFYYLSNQSEVPLTGRTQLVDLSKDQEAALGLQSYRSILNQSDVVRSGPEVDLVRKVGSKIATVVGDDSFSWEFNVIRSKQANAFALPGGKVAVYTGILPITQTEDGLAVVMGHEIAHAVARHGAERMAHEKLKQFGTVAVGMSVSDMSIDTQRMVMGAFGIGSQFGVLLPFSRKHESEADYMGLIYLARACYDPSAAPAVWERMGAQNSGAPPEFLSTHPSSNTRIAQFNEWMPEAKQVYQDNCG